MKAFMANPAKYVPALGGDCILCYANMNKRVAGTVHHAATRNGRLYLFPSAKEKSEYVANPSKYDNTDLAANGNCVVCQVEMGKAQPGSPEFTAVHNGLRYLFPSDKQRQMFLTNTTKYVGAGR